MISDGFNSLVLKESVEYDTHTKAQIAKDYEKLKWLTINQVYQHLALQYLA